VSAIARSRTRTRALVAAGLCGAAVVVVVVLAFVLSDNVVYFRTVSEAVERRAAEGDDRFRMAGEVTPGTIVETSDGVTFSVTEGGETVPVRHVGDPPDLFADGAPVVVEGRWVDGDEPVFASDRILIKHGNEYTPPDADGDAGDSDAGAVADGGASRR